VRGSTGQSALHSKDRPHGPDVPQRHTYWTGKVLQWKLHLQDKDFHQQIPNALSRLRENNMHIFL